MTTNTTPPTPTADDVAAVSHLFDNCLYYERVYECSENVQGIALALIAKAREDGARLGAEDTKRLEALVNFGWFVALKQMNSPWEVHSEDIGGPVGTSETDWREAIDNAIARTTATGTEGGEE